MSPPPTSPTTDSPSSPLSAPALVGAPARGAPSIPLGVRHMVASAFFFSIMGLLVKLAGTRLPSSQLVLVRGAICLVLSWLWLRRAGVSPWGHSPRTLLLRGLFGTFALVCFYYALVTLPLADAVVISHTSPIFTAALAAMFLEEPLSARVVGAFVCCAGGVLAITRPAALFGGASAGLDSLGVAVAFGGALASACVYVLIRRIRSRESPLVVVFYFPLVTVPVLLPYVATRWLWPTPLEWLILAGIGVATQLAQVQMTRGLVLLPAGRATMIGYIQVVLAAMWGALFFGEVPDLLTVGGALLILAAIISLMLPGLGRRPRTEDGIVA